MKYIKLPIEHGQAILNYLASRPYQEVFQILPLLQRAEAAEETYELTPGVPGEGTIAFTEEHNTEN